MIIRFEYGGHTGTYEDGEIQTTSQALTGYLEARLKVAQLDFAVSDYQRMINILTKIGARITKSVPPEYVEDRMY